MYDTSSSSLDLSVPSYLPQLAAFGVERSFPLSNPGASLWLLSVLEWQVVGRYNPSWSQICKCKNTKPVDLMNVDDEVTNDQLHYFSVASKRKGKRLRTRANLVAVTSVSFSRNR